MKKLLSIIAVAVVALAGAFSASAQDDVTLLTVSMKDGSIRQFNVPDKPEVTFADGKMLINSGEMSGEYDFAEVSHFTFEKGGLLSGIEDIKVEENVFTFSFTDNATVILAAPALQWASLYSVQGTQLANVKAVDGVATIDVSSLAPGVYVVAPSCHPAIKIVKH